MTLVNVEIDNSSESLVRTYLDTFFKDIDCVSEKEFLRLYEFWIEALGLTGGGVALELGIGPTLYTTIPLAKTYHEIHLADYVEASLYEIQRWLDGRHDAFDWDSFVRLSLQTEGAPITKTAVEQRKNAMRKAITRVMTCDMRTSPVIPSGVAGYDLVTAHYCTEVAAENPEEWGLVISNITELLRPGGALLLSIAVNVSQLIWTHNSSQAPRAIDISLQYAKECLEKSGMDLESMKAGVVAAPPRYSYRETLLLFVKKKPDG